MNFFICVGLNKFEFKIKFETLSKFIPVDNSSKISCKLDKNNFFAKNYEQIITLAKICIVNNNEKLFIALIKTFEKNYFLPNIKELLIVAYKNYNVGFNIQTQTNIKCTLFLMEITLNIFKSNPKYIYINALFICNYECSEMFDFLLEYNLNSNYNNLPIIESLLIFSSHLKKYFFKLFKYINDNNIQLNLFALARILIACAYSNNFEFFE